MALLLENGTQIPFPDVYVGIMAEGGKITSLIPFATSGGYCVIDGNRVNLHSTGEQFIAVYLENVSDIYSHICLFVFWGNTTEELKSQLIDRLQWDAEHIPTIEFYASRLGVPARKKLGPVIDAMVDSVYVYMR
jgi:hypothetical protein